MQIPKQAIFLSCLRVYSDFSYFMPGLSRLLGWILGAVLGISAVSATFSRVFSGSWGAEFWVLFYGFLQFQLLFHRFFPAFGLVFGLVLEYIFFLSSTRPERISSQYTIYCFLFSSLFLNALFSGLFAQKFSHLFYLRTIVLHVFQIILFHGLILHFFFIEPLSCFSLRCKQHCLILWRKYLLKAAG